MIASSLLLVLVDEVNYRVAFCLIQFFLGVGEWDTIAGHAHFQNRTIALLSVYPNGFSTAVT